MDSIYEKASKRARKWQISIEKGRLPREKRFHMMMKAMLKNNKNKSFLIELLDQSFRSKEPQRMAKQLKYLFKKYPDYDFFPWLQSLALFFFKHVGLLIPGISVPLFTHALREELNSVVLKSEDDYLRLHIEKREQELTTVNVNFIGESVLGEKEAKRRMKMYLKAIESDDIHYVSIKISTIYSQISPLCFDVSLKKLVTRLDKLYSACLEQEPHTFINLDMEAYHDVELSVAAFKQTLMLPHLEELNAGIALQSYLPDAFAILEDLTAWAKERVMVGGSPIKIRLVKGANAEMEAFQARNRGWENVIFSSKEETDANFKKMMQYMLDAKNTPYVHVGIASHNLFDQALAYEIAKKNKIRAYFTAEMLEGMSEAAYQTLKAEDINCILYAPVSSKEDFNSAIAYLVRRFDENTAEDNFMRHSFNLHADSFMWERLKAGFLRSVELIPELDLLPKRQQDRHDEVAKGAVMKEVFLAEADTDFSLKPNRLWAQEIINKWSHIADEGGFHVACVIDGEMTTCKDVIKVMDKSQYHGNVEVGSFSQANKKQLQEALICAKEDRSGWRKLSLAQRQELLHETAHLVKQRRGDLIGLAAADCGKSISESDVEVSEAVDFLEFYALSVAQFAEIEGLEFQAKGVGVVITPWNFPIAIAAGGISAALATGNTVLFKPASASTLVAYMLCQCFWDAGISKETLQFIPASSTLISEVILPSPLIDFVIFTGSEESAYKIRESNTKLHISAETGGKNATIVTALADRDQAIKNVLHSAFSHSGQKCSATSLLILERELYDDIDFRQTLKDAVLSLHVGSIWELNNKIGPLTKEVDGFLKVALENLQEHESWLLAPVFLDNNPYVLKPSIRWGTQVGDFCHQHELFGPVLTVMKADDLSHAIEIANSTGYGLTASLESLDKREQAYFSEHMQAGNLYINRPTTGAIVMRQPFGGMKKSSFGRGIKAGGPSYVTQFMNYTSKVKRDYSEDMRYWYDNFFSQEEDYFKILGESNTQRFTPIASMLLIVDKHDAMDIVEAYVKASELTGVELTLGCFCEGKSIKHLQDNCCAEIKYYDKESFVEDMAHFSRIRVFNADNLDTDIFYITARHHIYINSEAFVPFARIEMLNFFYEQTLSNAYHRYGNIIKEDI